MHPPKIAIMLPKFSRYGGVEGFAWRLSETLGKKYRVDFICARQETDPPKGVRIISVGRPFLGKFVKIFWFALAAEWTRRRGQYDVSIGLGNTIVQDILRISGGPTRIFWKHSIRAYPKGFARIWKMTRRILSPANNLVLAIEKLQVRFSAQIIMNSHLVRDWTLEAFPRLRNHKPEVIYNRPDLTKFLPCEKTEQAHARRKLGLAQDATIIATAGTNFILKGIGPLITTMSHLPENTLLIIAGGRHPGKYQRQAQRLGLEQRVHFLGKVEDMATFYQASDLFILLSFYDACSNAVLEALASGLPVISTTTNGSSFFLPKEHIVPPDIAPLQLAEIITHSLGETGSFSFPKDIPAGMEPYAQHIEALL